MINKNILNTLLLDNCSCFYPELKDNTRYDLRYIHVYLLPVMYKQFIESTTYQFYY